MTQLVKFSAVMVAWLLLLGTAISAEPDAPIPRVVLGGIAYSNVVIESMSAKSITFSHTRGMASVNRQKLKLNDLVALGLADPPSTNSVSSTDTNKVMSVERIRKSIDTRDVEKYLRDAGISLKTLGVGAVVFYLFFSFCLLMICSKASQPSPLLVFLPVLQMLAAYRAAKMSPFWFWLLLGDILTCVTLVVFAFTGHLERLPQSVLIAPLVLIAVLTLIQLIGWVIWCFKICVAREKSPLIGFLMLLPCTQVLALAYLAFSE